MIGIRIILTVLVLMSAFSSFAQTSFDCEPLFYQITNGGLRAYDAVTGNYGSSIATVDSNSGGYNLQDDLLYATDGSENVLRVGQDGTVVNLGIPTGSGTFSSGNAAVVDDEGNLWTRNSSSVFHKVLNVTTGTTGNLTYVAVSFSGVTGNPNVADIAFINDHFYGVRGTDLYDWDLDSGNVSPSPSLTVSSISGLSGAPSINFGAVFTDVSDRLYISNNAGGLYLIEDYTTNSPTASYLNSTQVTTSNDGFACPLAESAIDQDNDNILDPLDEDVDGDGITNIEESGAEGDPYADGDNDGIFAYLDDDDGDAGTGNDDGEIESDFDFDGDGIPNFLDLDSDGDGIYDIVEATSNSATLDTNNDGRIDDLFDGDSDGIPDAVETIAGGNNWLTPINSDTDINDNYLDIDSDGDGIVDIIEAQSTVSYLAPSGDDTDNDGVDDNFDPDNGGIAIDPVNSDGESDNDDYLDTDSDEDGISDSIEAYDTNGNDVANTTPAGTDADLDGLDDNFDIDDANLDPDNGGQTSGSFPDDDEPGLEADWRDESGNPNINLDVNNSGGGLDNGGFQSTFTEDGGAISISDVDGATSDRGNTQISSLVITLSGILNGDQEVLNIDGTDFPLGTVETDKATTGFEVTYNGSTTFTITGPSDAIMLITNVNTLIRGITYDNANNTPSETDRVFTFVVTDLTANQSNNAVGTVSVVGVNDAPITDDITNSSSITYGDKDDIDNPTGSDSDGTVVSYRIKSLPASGKLYHADGITEITDEEVLTIAEANGLKYLSGNVGNQSYTLSAIDNDGAEDATPATYTIEITAKPIEITADAKSKVYGASDPSLTYTITSGSLESGDSFTGSLTRAAGEDVGTYAISVGTVSAGSNYSITFVSDDLTITAKAIEITADAQLKDYGDADPTLTYTITSGSLESGDSFTGSLTREAGEDAGDYAILVGTVTAGSNYATTFVSADLTITPNENPIADADALTVDEGSNGVVDVVDGDTDSDGTLALNSIVIVDGPDNGTLIDNGDGTIGYTHDGSETTSDSFTYTINDEDGGTSNVAVVSITVNEVNDPPIADDFSLEVASLDEVIIGLYDLVTDVDDDSFNFSIITPPSNGTSTVSGNNVSYSSEVGFDGVLTLTYQVCDESGACDTGVITITIPKLDSDEDGIPDEEEGEGDSDGDGTPDYLDEDSDGDDISDKEEGNEDSDGDGTPDYLDEDSDNDGISDEEEGNEDSDGDGIPDNLDTDSDGDGIADEDESDQDTDGDGIPDYLDLDSDGDNTPDAEEGLDDEQSAEVLNTVISSNSPYPYDRLQIDDIENFPNNHVQIFNRWGNKVWDIKDYDNQNNAFTGNGNSTGSGVLPTGTYFYVIDLGDGSSLIKGFVRVQ